MSGAYCGTALNTPLPLNACKVFIIDELGLDLAFLSPGKVLLSNDLLCKVLMAKGHWSVVAHYLFKPVSEDSFVKVPEVLEWVAR